MKKGTALQAGLTGAIAGMAFSALVNYFFLPVPETVFLHAFGNGMSGLASGFMGGFMAIKTLKEKRK
ncbi:MAG: hypothetical protein KBG02_16295 [Haliscomenobacter sp.]|nr:hypothetical protein [Haliscomenobacter sp.]